MKCFVIPVITGSTGIVIKELKKGTGSNTRTAFNRMSTRSSCTGTTHIIRREA
jgi:hypothetical protein